MAFATKSVYRRQLCNGKVFAPPTSVVLNETHLVSFVIEY